MIVGLGDSKIDWGFVDSLPYSPAPAPTHSTISIGPSTVRPAKPKPLAALMPVVGANDDRILGMPRTQALIVGGLALAGLVTLLLSQRVGGDRRVRNPKGGGVSSRDPEVSRAIDFRREFHWGYPARKVSRRRVSPAPRVLVELGRVHSVTYRTRKKGESAQLFEHEFEGAHPSLAMDIRNKRLHIVGGSYTVTADGITG